MTTDPIEQARLRVMHWCFMTDADAAEMGVSRDDETFESVRQLEQAILRYHPDVVRLVEAARRALPIIDDGEICNGCWRERCSTYAALTAALVPFKEVQE